MKNFNKIRGKMAYVVILLVPVVFMFNNCGTSKKSDSAIPSDILQEANYGLKPEEANVNSLKAQDKLPMFVASSEKFHKLMSTQGISENSKKIFAAQKKIVDELISSTILAKDCDELHGVVPTLVSGVYHIYPLKSATHPFKVRCVVKGTEVAMLPLSK